MKSIIVIHEKDKSDNDKSVIGVATSRANALEMIAEYYGKGQHVVTDLKFLREDNIDFTCTIEVLGNWGGFYDVWGEDFILNKL